MTHPRRSFLGSSAGRTVMSCLIGKAPTLSVRERYEQGVNHLVGGDEIEEGPEPMASTFSVRRKKSD